MPLSTLFVYKIVMSMSLSGGEGQIRFCVGPDSPRPHLVTFVCVALCASCALRTVHPELIPFDVRILNLAAMAGMNDWWWLVVGR